MALPEIKIQDTNIYMIYNIFFNWDMLYIYVICIFFLKFREDLKTGEEFFKGKFVFCVYTVD